MSIQDMYHEKPIGPTSRALTQTDELLAWARDEGLGALAEFLDKSADAAALFIPPQLAWTIIATKGIAFAGGQAWRITQARRLNNVINALFTCSNEKLDRLSEYTADEIQAIRNEIKDMLDQEYEIKARYLLELLEGRLSRERALAKDKHMRFKRWIVELDLVVLQSMAKKDPKRTETYLDTYAPKRHVADLPGSNKRPADEFHLYNLIPDEHSGLLPVNQLQGVGLLVKENIDSNPGEATVRFCFHKDFFEFCDHLKQGNDRPSLDDRQQPLR